MVNEYRVASAHVATGAFARLGTGEARPAHLRTRLAADLGRSRYRRRTAASRRRKPLTAPGPVPVGGLRMPSSSSFRTTALLCV
jgi:hypothetical protein